MAPTITSEQAFLPWNHGVAGTLEAQSDVPRLIASSSRKEVRREIQIGQA
jgi:hypothetical protein